MEEIGTVTIDGYDELENVIPEGATHFKLEIDTSGCYYQGEQPTYIVHFYKKVAE